MSGENLLDNIRSLRQKASKIYQNDNASPEQIDMANVYRGMAKTLEQAIDNGITDPDLLRRFQSARTQLAKIHDYRDATNFNTGIVDAAKIAKITAGDNSLSGDLAALGKAAGNFPSVFSSKVESKWYSPPRLQRSGPAGLAGALIGSQLGGLEGSIAGGAAGAGGAEIASMLAARHITSPAYQAGLKIPDLRIAPSSAWTPAPVAAPPETNALVQRDNANALRAAE